MEGFSSPSYVDYDGLRRPVAFSPDALRSAVNYIHKPGQLFLVSYPKCGSTWMQHVIMLILRKGQPIKDKFDFLLNTPVIEFTGVEAIDMMNGPGVIKLHFPFNLIRFSPHAKYIYIARNPKDCCVSFYYHTKTWFIYNFQNGTFDEFFELFLNGKTDYGDYFDNLLSWYDHKNDTNIHFITFENLKKDMEGEVSKLAKFIGEEYYNSLITDPTIMENMLYYSSFEYMKKKFNEDMNTTITTTADPTNGASLATGLKYFLEFKSKYAPKEDTPVFNLIRKGIVGDWKSHFTLEQEERMEQWIKRRTDGSDVMNLWKDIAV